MLKLSVANSQLSSILPHNKVDGLSHEELVANMGGMIVAGSETIAT